MTFKRITVRWADHWVDYGDSTLSNIKENSKPVYGNYTGYLVYENKQMIVICANIWDGEDGEANFSDPMYIMKRCVTNKEYN
jgi:hypothetical protein